MATVDTLTYDSVTDSTAITLTLASLATSASLVAGRESTAISNVSNQFLDAYVSGQITVGTTPTTAKSINVYVYALLKHVSSAASYPIATATALTGVDAAATFEIDQLNAVRLAASINIIATSDRAYSVAPFSVAALFGGVLPIKWGIFVTHNTGVNLNATAGNHWFHWQGVKVTHT